MFIIKICIPIFSTWFFIYYFLQIIKQAECKQQKNKNGENYVSLLMLLIKYKDNNKLPRGLAILYSYVFQLEKNVC